MEKFEYKYEAGEQGVILAGSGDLMDMVTHITRQAQIINTRLRSRNAEAAASFRAALGALFMDPSSPVWEDGPEVRQGIEKSRQACMNHSQVVQPAGRDKFVV